MTEPDPKPAAASPQELHILAHAAIRTADRCIRINRYEETIRLLELAAANLKRITGAA